MRVSQILNRSFSGTEGRTPLSFFSAILLLFDVAVVITPVIIVGNGISQANLFTVGLTSALLLIATPEVFITTHRNLNSC
ncbi:hypothetical protein [Pseudonocardia sp.]|uniref:hypothetical protein n=1 Tax=Pseudonocardia sp. TaxID=60912 RepID=UPI00260A9F55|nr:hypothetical protein [Pseudonocardia sp.]